MAQSLSMVLWNSPSLDCVQVSTLIFPVSCRCDGAVPLSVEWTAQRSTGGEHEEERDPLQHPDDDQEEGEEKQGETEDVQAGLHSICRHLFPSHVHG